MRKEKGKEGKNKRQKTRKKRKTKRKRKRLFGLRARGRRLFVSGLPSVVQTLKKANSSGVSKYPLQTTT